MKKLLIIIALLFTILVSAQTMKPDSVEVRHPDTYKLLKVIKEIDSMENRLNNLSKKYNRKEFYVRSYFSDSTVMECKARKVKPIKLLKSI